MKKISIIVALVIIALLSIMPGCKKETASTTTQVTGNLFGFVALYDQYGARVYSGLNNTAVNLYTPSNATLNVNTDSTGKFSYNNIVQGQYLISFANPGFGSIVNSPFGFLGEGSIDHDAKLSAIPNFSDSILYSPIDSLNTIILQGVFSGTDTRKRTYVVFVGSSPSVSSLPANYKTYYSGTANNNLTTFTVKIPVSDLNDAGFTSGSTVYFAAYGAAADFASTSNEEDYTTGRILFNALSPGAATASIVLP